MNTLVLKAEEMRAADIHAAQVLGVDSFWLMENAASALANKAEELLGFDKSKKISVFCGIGNNGGDGFVAADILFRSGYGDIQVFNVLDKNYKGDALRAYERCNPRIISDCGDGFPQEAKKSDLIIDCIFGTGFNGVLTPDMARIISEINSCRGIKLSCDIPSGCGCDNGRVSSVAVKADVTVTFAAYKPCFFLYPASEYCGRVTVSHIGIPEDVLLKQNPKIRIITDDFVKSLFKKRPAHSHKGTFGGVQLVCGSKRMTGAAVLAAMGALRSGVGLVYVESGRYVRKILQTILPEPVFVKKKAKTKSTSFVVGCGLGKKAKYVKRVLKGAKPTVVDPDSISYLGKKPHIIKKKRCKTVLTPHPLEFSRLLGSTVDSIESDRLKSASFAACEYDSVIVLKGQNTVIADPNGDIFINTTGNSGLAKGGSGDVLSGMIGSFLAQGYSPAESAVLGVYFHGLAADELLKSTSASGILPSDIPETVGELLKKYEDLAL